MPTAEFSELADIFSAVLSSSVTLSVTQFHVYEMGLIIAGISEN